MSTLADDIRARFKWRAVVAPRPWLPVEVGEELIGYYGGRTVRTGAYGQYEVILLHVPLDGCYMLTGTRVIQLMDASGATVGSPVRVIWAGLKETGHGHKMKMFEVMVAEGEVLAEAVLPAVA